MVSTFQEPENRISSLSPWRLNSGASQRRLLSLKEENENVHVALWIVGAMC